MAPAKVPHEEGGNRCTDCRWHSGLPRSRCTDGGRPVTVPGFRMCPAPVDSRCVRLGVAMKLPWLGCWKQAERWTRHDFWFMNIAILFNSWGHHQSINRDLCAILILTPSEKSESSSIPTGIIGLEAREKRRTQWDTNQTKEW